MKNVYLILAVLITGTIGAGGVWADAGNIEKSTGIFSCWSSSKFCYTSGYYLPSVHGVHYTGSVNKVAAVTGYTSSMNGGTYGIYGRSDSNSGYGVYGYASANSGKAIGVYGKTNSSSGYGVYGSNTSTSTTSYGVYGRSNSTSGRAVYGYVPSQTGITYGVYGLTRSNSGRAVYGWAISSSGTTYGVYGRSNSSSGYGVYSYGNMKVRGDFTCTGRKSALVELKDGDKVSLYAEESPENWFADYGSGRLKDGRTVVKIDPTFAQTVNTKTEYHVFLTPNGDCNGLYVTKKGEKSFEVRELHSGKANISFSYRIVVKRKGYESERLARVPMETDTKGSLSAVKSRFRGNDSSLAVAAKAD